MQTNHKKAAAVLTVSAVLALILPIWTLFTGDGFLASYIRVPENLRMLAEIFVLFLLAGASFCLIQNPAKKIAAAAILAVVFCWLHVVFLPMIVSACYLLFIMLAGRFLRTVIFKIQVRGKKEQEGIFESEWPADFLLGSSAVIALFCVLSAFGQGRISVLRTVCIPAGAGLYVWGILEFLRFRKSAGQPAGAKAGLFQSFCFTFLFVMVLIQVGKMNISLDFDTLWYGVRSEYILAGGRGIYENPGLVGMVYVYSKGLEVLTLPLSDLASHSYLLFFNVWLTVMGLLTVRRVALLFMDRRSGLLAVVIATSLPGIMNMSISAKPDIITWFLQLIMIEYFFRYVKAADKNEEKKGEGSERPVVLLILSLGAYLLSLTMKPTSLIFSTAVFGMMGIYLIVSRKFSLKASAGHWAAIIFPAAALIGIWARTMLITGMPVTSVFTSIFAKMGFTMKYPFATGSLPQNWQDESNLHVLMRRLYQILLAPEGKDMAHVIIAWGTSILFFLTVCLFVFYRLSMKESGKRNSADTAALVIFWPFLAVNLVSLVMLYQIDGNYFMLLYTFLILAFCRSFSRLQEQGIKKISLTLLSGLLIFNVLLSAVTNWAWSVGFSDLSLVNKGRANHRAMQQEDMINRGNAGIWEILSADPENRVIAFGEHPLCLEFPCNVQSYKDITSPWGNVDLVESAQTFETYMNYAKTDYVYVEAGHIGNDSWEWSYGLLRDLIAAGCLKDFFFENGNVLARTAKEKLTAEEATRNLSLFDENYLTSDMAKQQSATVK